MSSEKSRYLNRNGGLSPPLSFEELKKNLFSLGIERLVNTLWMSAQRDEVLCKALMAPLSIQLADGDWEKTKASIDYALSFPNYVRYHQRGYGLIIDKITVELKSLYKQGVKEFAPRAGQYVIELGRSAAQNFEDDWDWTLSLDNLQDWIKDLT